VSYVSRWRIHEGGGRYRTCHWPDSSFRWSIALCSNCAKDSLREGLTKDKEKTFLLKVLRVLYVLLVITLVLALFGLLPEPFDSLWILIGFLGLGTELLRLLFVKRQLHHLENGCFQWTAKKINLAIEVEAERIVDTTVHAVSGNHKPTFPLPSSRTEPPVGYPDECTREDHAFKVEGEARDNLGLKKILDKRETDPSTTTQTEIDILHRYMLPVCEFGRTQEETNVVNLVASRVTHGSLDDCVTRAAIQALGNSSAIESVPILIAVLEREQLNFVSKSYAEAGLRRITDHQIEKKESQFNPLTESADMAWDTEFREYAKEWRRWYEELTKHKNMRAKPI